VRDLKALAINLILYKIGWFGAVTLAAGGRPWAGVPLLLALIGVHLRLVPDWRAEVRLVAACGLLGAVVDTVQMRLGILTFEGGHLVAWLCPPWIILMWAQLGTTLRYCVRFLQGRYWLAAAMGAVAGPLSFLGGAKMGAVTLHPDARWSIASLALSWVAAMPFMMWLAGPRQVEAASFSPGVAPG